jgi:hypothetical protein
MADDGNDNWKDPHTLTLPMLFLADGEEVPAEWAAANPGYVSFPATLTLTPVDPPARRPPPYFPNAKASHAWQPLSAAEIEAGYRELMGLSPDEPLQRVAETRPLEQKMAPEDGAVLTARIAAMSDEDYSKGQDVVLPDGSFVDDPDSPTTHMRAPMATLEQVAQAGRELGRTARVLSLLTAMLSAGGLAALPAADKLYLAEKLGFSLGFGGTFDYQ